MDNRETNGSVCGEIPVVAQTEGRGKEQRKQLADNILSLYVLQGLNYLVPMAVLPYLIRVLGMEMYGLFAFAQSFAQYFTLLTDYGFNYSATRSIARQKEDHLKISSIFCSVLIIKLFLMLLGAIVLVVVVSIVPRFQQDKVFFFAGYTAVIGNVLFPMWFYQGLEQMKYISGIIGIARLGAGVALFVFVHHPTDALLALVIQSSVPVAGGVAGLWIAIQRFNLRLSWPSATELKAALVEGWHLFVSTAAVSLYTNTNVFLVGLLAGDLQAGYFSAAEKLIRAMQGLIQPVSQAVFPHMSTLVAESKATALRFAAETLRWMGGITLVACICLLLLAKPVVFLLFGHSAAGSLSVVRWIAMLPFLVAISNVLGVQTMVTFGLDKQFSRILVIAGFFNVSLGIFLIRRFAASGAGASVLCTELLVTAVMILILHRHKIRIFGPGGVFV